MAALETINGYTLLEAFGTKGAGNSMWARAERDGQTYFIKKLLDPIYPDELVVTNESALERRRQMCGRFEGRLSGLCRKIDAASDGNLVRIECFFRKKTHYYIVMQWIQEAEGGITMLSALPLEDRLLACRTLAHSLLGLHRQGIIHGDIKPSNVLLCRTETGRYVTKLIDLDTCRLEEELRDPSLELMGDQIYLAPETCQRIFGEDVTVTAKADVFAAGLMFHQYLTGQLPAFDREKYRYAYVAVLDGKTLGISDRLSEPCRALLADMLRPQEARCTMEEAYRRLSEMAGISVPGAGPGEEEKGHWHKPNDDDLD